VTVDHRPRRLRRVASALALLVVIVFGGVASLLKTGEEVFGRTDQVAFFLIGLLIASAVLAFTRFRVRGDEHGIWVRNAVGERFFPWEVVVGLDLPEGATWAQLELHDDETVAVLAIQTSDGDEAVDALIALRRLLKAAGRG
jgi:membrane protease YdiL (CAAX protease family)